MVIKKLEYTVEHCDDCGQAKKTLADCYCNCEIKARICPKCGARLIETPNMFACKEDECLYTRNK